jgi:hypothetical protein
VIAGSSTKLRKNASNRGESTLWSAERITTMSLTAVEGPGGNAASRTSSARSVVSSDPTWWAWLRLIRPSE